MKKVGMILLSIVFLAWFFASMGAMIYCSRHDMGAIVVILFGQYFLVFGTIAIIANVKSHSFKPIILLFPLIGICAMIGGCIYQFGTEEIIKQLEKILPDLILGAFIACGAVIVVVTYLNASKKKKNCTLCVNAKIVDKLVHVRDGATVTSPVYEVYYRGEMQRLCDQVFTNMDKCEIGDVREIYINPDRPDEFYDPKIAFAGNAIAYVIGFAFFGFSIFGILMYHLYG